MKKEDVKKQLKKEAIVTVILYIFYFVWWYGFAYGLGDKEVSEYKYILGLPEWFFYSCVLGFLVMSTLVYFVVKYFFKEVPLDIE